MALPGNRFKSAVWERILLLANEWRQEAAAFVDDPSYKPRRLGTFTYDLMALCDSQGTIDTSLLWDMKCQIDIQSGKTRSGRRVRQAELEAKMMRCVGVLDRLQLLGTAEPAAIEDQGGDGIEWSKPVGYTDLRKALGVSHNTLKARLVDSAEPVVGRVRYKAPPRARKIQVVVTDLPADLQAKFRRRGKQASK